MNTPTDQHLYFMGICGTAMGSVAAAFRDLGFRVTGSDTAVYDPMKSFLESRGIEILDGYRRENLPDDADYFVVGNAQARGNPEVEAVLDEKRRFISLPELMREKILRGRRNLVVTGTHGKTTTSSMLAWLLESTGRNPNFVIGGIPGNFEQGARFTDSDFAVIEGDEYDSAFFDKRSKFVHYLPEVALVNNIEFDHADIFADLAAVKRSFGHMLRLVPSSGLIVMNGDDPNVAEVYREEGHAPSCRVGFGEGCDARIRSVDHRPASTSFSILDESYEIPMNGEYNVRNAAMAAVTARYVGLTREEVSLGLRSFAGVKRRQEIRGITERNITVVDDFGHHPTAIREAIAGMRHRYNGTRLWAVFEPRSNTTRRNVFQRELPEALGLADAVCLSQIARMNGLAPQERLNPDQLMRDLQSRGKPAFYEENAGAIVDRLKKEARENDVIIVFSNRGFDGIHDKLLAEL